MGLAGGGRSAGRPGLDAQQGLCEGVAAAVPDLGSLPVDGGGREPAVAAPLRDQPEILVIEVNIRSSSARVGGPA